MAPLTLHNSLTRTIEPFRPIDPATVRVYTCGPTVYNYQHVGNMRAFLFADTLTRVLRWKEWPVTHVINITDVGHLTSDADAGDDKMERAATASGRSIWDIAAHYTDVFKADVAALNIAEPSRWAVATDHIAPMIAFAQRIESDHCYRLPGGLYFDTTTVPDYGRLARGVAEVADTESRIAEVAGKRHPADFAIWRTSQPGENRQMEWDSPWGRGAPGWHLECSVMSQLYLGQRFDIHTGGIDHREIHHPNEIAQNQAHCCPDDRGYTGATVWMHNNFLVANDGGRGGKMSKSSGEFLRLQLLIDRGYHPLAFRLMCLQAHYRSEMEWSWDGLTAALTRLKRLAGAVENLRARADDDALDEEPEAVTRAMAAFDAAVSDDLNTAQALVALDEVVAAKRVSAAWRLWAVGEMDQVLGLNLSTLTRADLRVRPVEAAIHKATVEARLRERTEARAAKDFPRSDAIRAELAAAGVEVMDGDPLGWDWRV